jgi:hypothetical protein
VDDPVARGRLDHILERELGDPGAWLLLSDGSYSRVEAAGSRTPGSQERLIAESDERALADH